MYDSLVGQTIVVDVGGLILGLLIMIVIPTMAGLVMNQLIRDQSKINKFSIILSPLAKVSLPLVIAINSSSLAPFIKTIDLKFLKLIMVILFISISGFIFCWALSRMFRQNRENTIVLIFTGGMRNFSTGILLQLDTFLHR